MRDDIEATVELWQCSDLLNPNNDPNQDVELKPVDSAWGFFVMAEEEKIIGSIMIGYDGHLGWVNYLACHPDYRRRRVETALMNRARQVLLERDCPKINLQVRDGNISAIKIYERFRYLEDHVRSYGLRLATDGSLRPDQPEPTALY